MDVFAIGEVVDVTGMSKGKGFAGTIRRWNFQRGPCGSWLEEHQGTRFHRECHLPRSGHQREEDGRPKRQQAGHADGSENCGYSTGRESADLLRGLSREPERDHLYPQEQPGQIDADRGRSPERFGEHYANRGCLQY